MNTTCRDTRPVAPPGDAPTVPTLLGALALGAAVLFSGQASAREEAFREALHPHVQSRQFVLYARADDHGFGIQFNRKNPIHPALLGAVGFLMFGPAAIPLGDAAARSQRRPTELSLESANRLVPMYDRADTQRYLEQSLARQLEGSSLTATPVAVRELGPSATMLASMFDEDPVLIVDLHASMTPSYRALQVTAIVYGLSSTKAADDPAYDRDGRVYLNRFDYLSEPLPAPELLTSEQRRQRIRELKQQFSGELTEEQKNERRNQLRRVDGSISPFAEAAVALLDLWTSDSGARLRHELHAGTDAVIGLMVRDLHDPNPVVIDDANPVQVLDGNGRRQVVRYRGGQFAGALVSMPIGLNELSCEGVAFSRALSNQRYASLCNAEGITPGAVCEKGYADMGEARGCKKVKAIVRK